MEQLAATGHLVLAETMAWDWSTELTSEKVGRLFATFSDWTDREVRAASDAAEKCGGTVLEHCSIRPHPRCRT